MKFVIIFCIFFSVLFVNANEPKECNSESYIGLLSYISIYFSDKNQREYNMSVEGVNLENEKAASLLFQLKKLISEMALSWSSHDKLQYCVDQDYKDVGGFFVQSYFITVEGENYSIRIRKLYDTMDGSTIEVERL